MPNLKNQPSVSDSAKINDSSTNGRANSTSTDPDFMMADVIPQLTPDHSRIPQREIHIDPSADPSFLDEPEAPPLPVYRPKIANAPSPDDSTVQAPTHKGRSLRLQWRYFRIIAFAGWMFLRVMFWQVYVNRYFPKWVEKTNLRRWVGYTREFRGFAITRGGVFIKLGQFISTRVDILPEAIINELKSLQDEVPTISFKQILAVLERELGGIDAYEFVDETPIAAASLGQVHRAKLKSGEKVVVKVQRPNIREICYTDLAAMRVVATIAMRFRFIYNRSDAVGLVDEFGKVLLEELSYKHETYNAQRFAAMFKGMAGVYVPHIYVDHSTDQVLTIEDVSNIKIDDYDALEEAGINRKTVAKRLMDTYLHQIFNHYFFHADPHPGNLFVRALPNPDPTEETPFELIFIDFGMTGSLSHEIADGLVTTLHAVLNRDVRTMVKSYEKLGFLLPGADTDRIIEATQAAFDEIWGLSMSDLRTMDFNKLAELGDEFNDLIFDMPFYIPQDFIYLGRTVSILTGMCTLLDENYNPWFELIPYTDTLLARGFGIDIPKSSKIGKNTSTGIIDPRTLANANTLQILFSGNGARALRTLAEEMVRRVFPAILRTDETMKKLQAGEIRVITEMSVAQRQQLRRIEKESRNNSRSIFFGSIFISATLFYVNGEIWLALIGYGVCAVTYITGILKEA
jgi:predicted unusual protein kinase regulating ubiquinone biosynthesis (AarF/ABC1/UbiB family)